MEGQYPIDQPQLWVVAGMAIDGRMAIQTCGDMAQAPLAAAAQGKQEPSRRKGTPAPSPGPVSLEGQDGTLDCRHRRCHEPNNGWEGWAGEMPRERYHGEETCSQTRSLPILRWGVVHPLREERLAVILVLRFAGQFRHGATTAWRQDHQARVWVRKTDG